MRFKVWLFLCVGLVICCLRLKDFRRFENFIVLELWILLICMLKFFDINKFFLESIVDFRYLENLVKNILVGIWCLFE